MSTELVDFGLSHVYASREGFADIQAMHRGITMARQLDEPSRARRLEAALQGLLENLNILDRLIDTSELHAHLDRPSQLEDLYLHSLPAPAGTRIASFSIPWGEATGAASPGRAIGVFDDNDTFILVAAGPDHDDAYQRARARMRAAA